ncbi:MULTISPECIES: hypothetical protein [unclassified Pseudomonas]|uniref:hypothetical protein n=1 Tax=unclassified Pseudomonas TaxID=196821 RepID=UPI0020977CD5|nr:MULTISPECIES: hypothetical protein [unclassified Pseudomonas]MCO7506779.1 hypothetical protein [Pseudomonas sp. VE 267-6A]MCO7531477.1 hypothetical protein [Pseudomonas sp. 2]
MLYLFLPLDQHYDSGFGAVADSFKDAADSLNDPDKTLHFNSNLPVSFLYRHAIELYLKSAIITLHRKFAIPYGDDPASDEPSVMVGKKRKPLYNVHGLGPLYAELRALLDQEAEALAKVPRTDWVLPPELDGWIEAIEATDSSSTYFRYPITKDADLDVKKSTMQREEASKVIERMQNGGPPVKALMMVNDDYEVVDSFTHNDTSAKEILIILRDTSELFHGLHAMMSYTLAGGM